ncbi:hypothetical protein JTB14_014091 [Gonioctena quinquepunctata]|nr:hypothetical protein JTB14_014091 [Gonioctena quinquepunctata]
MKLAFRNLLHLLCAISLLKSIESHDHLRENAHYSRHKSYKNNLLHFNQENTPGSLRSIEFSALTENHQHHLRHQHDEVTWPVKKEAIVEGDLILGGLMMVHEREDSVTCGPIMPQGGIQALEAMLFTLDKVNSRETCPLPDISLGAHILDDCDKDTYGLEMAVDFIKGELVVVLSSSAT